MEIRSGDKGKDQPGEDGRPAARHLEMKIHANQESSRALEAIGG